MDDINARIQKIIAEKHFKSPMLEARAELEVYKLKVYIGQCLCRLDPFMCTDENIDEIYHELLKSIP